MTVSGISHYRGGTIDGTPGQEVEGHLPQTRDAYRPSRFQTGPNVGDWFVVVQYADQTAYEKAQVAIAQDPECQQTFVEIESSRRGLAEKWSSDL